MSYSNSILLIDPAFDADNARHCQLLLKIGRDNFSYAIVNRSAGKVIAVYDIQECEDGLRAFTNSLTNDSTLKMEFAEIKIAVYTENTISIPNVLYHPDEALLHTGFFTGATSTILHAAAQAHFGFTTIFNFPVSAENSWIELKGKFLPYNAGLLCLAENSLKDTLNLDFTAGSFTVLFVKGGQLIFQHHYEIEDHEEFNYFLLLLISTLNIDTGETAVRLSGIIHENDENFSCIKKYFKDISFLLIPELDQEVTDDLPSHYYTSLLALDQCGS